MREIDRPDFLSAMRRLGTAFQRDIDDELLEVFWDALEDLDIGSVRRGVDRSLRSESPHFPTPGQIRDRAGGNAPPCYSPPLEAPRIGHGNTFDNLAPDEARRHVELLRKGVNLMRAFVPRNRRRRSWRKEDEEAQQTLSTLLPRAEEILAHREAELSAQQSEQSEGWEH